MGAGSRATRKSKTRAPVSWAGFRDGSGLWDREAGPTLLPGDQPGPWVTGVLCAVMELTLPEVRLPVRRGWRCFRVGQLVSEARGWVLTGFHQRHRSTGVHRPLPLPRGRLTVTLCEEEEALGAGSEEHMGLMHLS